MGNSTLSLGGGDARRISEVITQPGHSFVVGDVVRSDDTTPAEYVLAQADTAVNAEAVGIIETVAGDSFELVYQGRVDLSGASWTDLPFAATSEVWFLSPTIAGELTRTPPNTAGTVIKAMLVVTDDSVGNEEGVLTGYIGVQIGGESTIDLSSIQPVGTILTWAAPISSPVPSGWLVCDGSTLDKVDFPELFDIIGNTYGNVDPDFDLPDLRGRVGVGLDGVSAGVLTGNNSAGDTGGEEDHILTVAELPDHQLTLGQHSVAFSSGVNQTLVPLGSAGVDLPQGFTPDPGNPPNPVTGVPHNTMQPFLVLNYIIRVTAQSTTGLLDHDLSQHSDVGDVTNPNDCDLFKFNAGTGQWEAAPGAAAAGTAVNSFRNQFINGKFAVWQRGLTFNNVFGIYTADRWQIGGSLDGGAITSQIDRTTFPEGQTDVPGNPKYHMDFQGFVTGGSGSESVALAQRIESVLSFAGETVTVSFWAKADTPGPHTIAIGFRQTFGTGGGASASVSLLAQEITTLNNTWQYFTLTFSIDSILGKTIGTSGTDSLRLRIFTQAAASVLALLGVPNTLDFQDTVSFANMQVEVGSAATAFEIRDIATEIALCQRYFCKAWDIDQTPSPLLAAPPGVFDAAEAASGGQYRSSAFFGASGNGFTAPWPVRMRAAPTVLVVHAVPGSIFVLDIGEGSATWNASSTNFQVLWTADAEL